MIRLHKRPPNRSFPFALLIMALTGCNGPINTADNQTSSVLGINGDGRARRGSALNRRGRNNLSRRMQGEREVRTYDGSSNNEANATWGATFEHLQRLSPPEYGDGISTLAGAKRLGAREISNLMAAQADGESIPNTFGTSDFLWQWGQFLDHDIDLTDGSEEPANIPVPTGDAFFDPDSTGTIEIPLNRALFDPSTGTSTDNPREQENEITSWIDASMVYGSDEARVSELRVGPDSPFLAVSEGNLLPFNVNDLTNANGFVRETTTLFLAGDVRANEQIGLTVMHTLMVREHNRLALSLQQARPNADPNELFEATRRLVIAEIQKITYDEYLPALLGPNTMPTYEGYDNSINPTIYNGFSTAAYRLGHSQINDDFLRLDASRNSIELGPLPLREGFFASSALLISEDDLEPIIRGLATQSHQAIDRKIVNDLRNFLFGQPGQGGFDLAALNVQRGRDHGLASYNNTREALGLGRVRSFVEITSDPETQSALQAAYTSVDDIDLWVGGMSEDPLRNQGSQLGPLFTAILVKQFDELRAGDRFWYERYLHPDEMRMIERTTLSSLIKANTNIGAELQSSVFYVPGEAE